MVTFALYKRFPITCEGNDIPGEARELKIWMKDSPNLRKCAEDVAMELAVEHGGHAQVWHIE